jgi:hypothetical protein
MAVLDVSGESFVVKVWVEDPPAAAEAAHWRGHVTHVNSGERRYVQRLDDIPLIIMPHLQDVGVRFGTVWRLRQWLFERSRRRVS